MKKRPRGDAAGSWNLFPEGLRPGSAGFGPRVRLVVGVPHATAGQVRVDLGAGERLVSQELLHRSQVRAVVEQVRREAVPDRVGADVRIQANLLEVLRDLAADGSAGKATKR